MPNSEVNLETYREYLNLLGRMQVEGQMAAKVDVSGVVQTTLFEAHEQQTNWEAMPDEARLAWLRRIFSNNLIDEIRRFRTKARDVAREKSLEQSLEQSASRLDEWLVNEKTSPSQHAMRNEQAVRLAKALACLPSSQREAVEMHYLKKLTLAEVARQMGKTEGAVTSLIFRGTRKLRELLSDSTKGK